MYTILIGTFRTWRTQNAVVRGKAISGGLEIVLLFGGILIVSSPIACLENVSAPRTNLILQLLLLFFTVLVAIDVEKEDLKVT